MSSFSTNSDIIPLPQEIVSQENWEQTPLPTSEALALDLTIAKEKAAELRRMNAPPKGQSSGWNKTKSKKMMIFSRQTNAKHVPYWNVRFQLEMGEMKDSCLQFYSDYLEFVRNRIANGENIFLGDLINNKRIIAEGIPTHSHCSCAHNVTSHFRSISQIHYDYPEDQRVGELNVDFQDDVSFKPSGRRPVLFQQSRMNWNVRKGSPFMFTTNNAYHNILLMYCFKVAQYGSFIEARNRYLTDSTTIKFGNSTGYRLFFSETTDLPVVTHADGVAFVESLLHGGISARDIPSLRNLYVQLYQNVSVAHAKEIAIRCQRAWEKRVKTGIWSKAPGFGYKDLLNDNLLRTPFHFIRSVVNIYRSICTQFNFPAQNVVIRLDELLMFASYYWNTPNSLYCEHGNFPMVGYKQCVECDCEFSHYQRTVSGNSPCECMCGVRKSVIKRPSNYVHEFIPSKIVRYDILPTSDTATPGPSTSKVSGFFDFVRSCYQMPEEPTTKTPEEGGEPTGSMRSLDSWLTIAIEKFFHSFKDFVCSSFSEFKSTLSGIWDVLLDTIRKPLNAISGVLQDMASPIVGLLEKFLKAVGLGWFTRGRNLTVDLYSIFIGFLVFNAVSNPLIRLLIVLYYANHFNVIPNVKGFITFLRDNFYSGQSDLPIDGLEDDDDDEIKPTNLIVTFLTYLSSTSFVQLLVKASVAIVISVAGIAATTSHKAHLTKTFVDMFRNMGYIGQGIAGIAKVWSTIASSVPKLMKWVRSKMGAQNQEDIEEEKKEKLKEKYKKKLFDFIVVMRVWDCEEGYRTIKRSKDRQLYFVNMRPMYMMLHRASLSPDFRDIFDRDILQAFREACKSYTKIFDIVYRVCAYGNFRQTPFHVQLMGKPGVGKSSLLQSLANNIRDKYFPDVPSNCLTYSRGNTDHFDGYANQPIMIQDDMWSTDDYRLVSEILPLISNAPIVIPMAQLTDKATFFDSKFILSTTNTPFPTTTAVRCNEAIWRRRHIFCQVTCDEDCYDKTNSKFCMDKFKVKYPGLTDEEMRRTMPHLKFDIYSPIPSGGGLEPATGYVLNEYDPNNIPSGLAQPLTNLNYLQFLNQCYSRYDVLCNEEKNLRQDHNSHLKDVREIYELVSELLESNNDPTSLGPISSSFLDFDFADTCEAEEPATPDAEEEAASATNESPSDEAKEDPSWEDFPDDWEPEFPEGFTPDGKKEDPEATSDSAYDKWRQTLTAEDQTFWKEIRVLSNTRDGKAQLEARLAKMIDFYNRHCNTMPAHLKDQLESWIDKAQSSEDPERDRRRADYEELKKKKRANKHMSRGEKSRFKHYEKEFEPHLFAGARPKRQRSPTPAPPCNFKNPRYIPYAGETIPAEDFDLSTLNPANFEYDGVLRQLNQPGRCYHRAKPTTCVMEDDVVMRVCDKILPKFAQKFDEIFCKSWAMSPDGTYPDWYKRMNKYFGWDNSFTSAGLFHPIKFDPKQLDITLVEEECAYIQSDLDGASDLLSTLPADFVSRIVEAEFSVPYLNYPDDAPARIDAGQPVNTVVSLEYAIEKDYGIRESFKGQSGAMTKKQWEDFHKSCIHSVCEHMSFNARNQFLRDMAQDPYNTLVKDREYSNYNFSPYYLSETCANYIRIFDHLPESVKLLIVRQNKATGARKLNDIRSIRQHYRDILKYYTIKYSSLIHKTPHRSIIGLGDVMVTAFCAIYAGIIFMGLKRMFASLFGLPWYDPKPTSRVLFKRSLPSHLSPRPTNLVATEDMHHQICKNLIQVYHPDPKCGYANAIGIDGQNILVNLHWVRPLLESGKDFVLHWKPSPQSSDFWEATVRFDHVRPVPNSDACFIHSVDFRMFAQIKHRFVLEDDLKKYELPSSIHQTFYDRDSKIALQSAPMQGVVSSLPVNFLDTKLSNVIEYKAPIVVGMSGSPIYANYTYANNRMILGIQSCANAERSFACIITQEIIDKYCFPSIQHQGPVLVNNEITPTSDLITEHLNVVGSIPIYRVTGMGGKTCFSKTPFADSFPSERIPAVLSPFDPRVPQDTHPLSHSVNKFGRDIIRSMPTDILDRAVEDITRLIQSRIGNFKPRVLNIEESILGLQQPGHEKINIKTSPGVPWVWSKVLPGKKTWIDVNELGDLSFLSSEIRTVFNDHDALLRNGIIPSNSFYEFPKDELRPFAKAIGPPMKTRSISVMDFTFSLLYRRYCLDLEAKLHQLADGTFPSCVGINPHSTAWHHLYKELSSRSKVGNDFDISNWDGHFPGWLFNAVANVFNNIYDDDFAVPRMSLFMNACFGYTNFMDVVLQKNRGMPSGFAGTAIVNTIGHIILFYCFYLIQCRQYEIIPSLNAYNQHVASFFYGDDVIFTISDEYKDLGISAKGFIDLYNWFGWPITSASKLGDPSIERNISDLTFLKRRFKIDHLFGTFIVLGQIEESVIFDLLHWIRKTPNPHQQLLVNINEALEFAFSHGSDFYNRLQRKLSKLCHKHNLGHILPSYTEMRSVMIDRYLNM